MAGAERKVGITIAVKDRASKAVKSFAGAAKGAAGKVSSFASGTVKAFSKVGGAVIALNQGIELLKNVFAGIKNVMAGPIDAMTELRGETDPLVRDMAKLATRGKAVQASLGTTFAAALTAVGQALTPINNGTFKWLEANRKLIATNMITWLAKLATAMIKGVAFGATFALKAYVKFNTVLNFARSILADFIGDVADWALSLDNVLGRLSPFSEETVAMFNTVKGASKDVVDEFAKDQLKMEEEVKALTKRIESASGKIQSTINNVTVKALKRLHVILEKTGGTPTQTAEQALFSLRKTLSDLIPVLDAAALKFTNGLNIEQATSKFDELDRKMALWERRLEFSTPQSIMVLRDELESMYALFGVPITIDINPNRLDVATEKLRAFKGMLEGTSVSARQVGAIAAASFEPMTRAIELMHQAGGELIGNMATLGNSFGAMLSDVKQGVISIEQAMQQMALNTLNTILETVERVVMAYAIEAAVAAFKANSGFPGIGLALGLAAAGTALSMARGFLTQMPQPMAQGGWVTGGVPNKDSVPIMAMPGEYVMSKKEVSVAQKNGGRSPSINIELNSQLPPTRAEMKKFVRQNIVPALHELRSQGMF